MPEVNAAADIQSVGVVGLFIIMVLRTVFDFMKHSSKKELEAKLDETLTLVTQRLMSEEKALERIADSLKLLVEQSMLINQKVSDLHVWHSPDSRGKQVWKQPLNTERLDVLVERLNLIVDRLEQQAIPRIANKQDGGV